MVLFIFFLYHILSFLFTPLYKCIQYICVYKQKMMLTNQLSCRERERVSIPRLCGLIWERDWGNVCGSCKAKDGWSLVLISESLFNDLLKVPPLDPRYTTKQSYNWTRRVGVIPWSWYKGKYPTVARCHAMWIIVCSFKQRQCGSVAQIIFWTYYRTLERLPAAFSHRYHKCGSFPITWSEWPETAGFETYYKWSRERWCGSDVSKITLVNGKAAVKGEPTKKEGHATQ